MNMKSNDLKIAVGIKAYEEFTGKKLTLKEIHLDEDKLQFRRGVLMVHLPTEKKAYCNSETSQSKNKKIAFEELEKQMSTGISLNSEIKNIPAYEIELEYFKVNGTYYTSGKYSTNKEQLDDVLNEIKTMKENKTLPGITGNEFIIHVNANNHPQGYPLLIL